MNNFIKQGILICIIFLNIQTSKSENNKLLEVCITNPEEQKQIQPSSSPFLSSFNFICKNIKVKPYDNGTITVIDFYIFCSSNKEDKITKVEIEITFNNSFDCSYDKKLIELEISNSPNDCNIIKIHTNKENFLKTITLNDENIDKNIVQKIKDIIKETDSKNPTNLKNEIKN